MFTSFWKIWSKKRTKASRTANFHQINKNLERKSNQSRMLRRGDNKLLKISTMCQPVKYLQCPSSQTKVVIPYL